MAVVKSGEWWVFEWSIGGKKIRRSSGFRVTEVDREHVRQLEEEARARAVAELAQDVPAKGGPQKAPRAVTFTRPKTSTSTVSIPRRGQAMKLSAAIERYYREAWSRQRDGERSFKIAKRAMDIIGDKYLHEITSDDIAEVMMTLIEDGRTGATANRYRAAISAVLNRACNYWQVIDAVPKAPKMDEAGARIRVVTHEEEARILEACDRLDDQDFKDLFIVLIDTGLRRMEALNLQFSDIDWNYLVMTVPILKQRERRYKTIPLTKRVQEILRRRAQTEKSNRPFACFAPYQPMKRLQRALREAGLPEQGDIVIHSLRHTFASRLVRAGVPIYEVKELLGHASVTTTERFYAHMAVDTLKDSIAILERMNATQIGNGSVEKNWGPTTRTHEMIVGALGVPQNLPQDSHNLSHNSSPISHN